MRLNKIGEDKILSPWWFLMMIVIVGSVVLVTMNFLAKDIDVRDLSAEILYNRVAECMVENAYLVDEFNVESSSWEIYSNCNLKSSVFEKGEGYYLEVLFNGVEKISAGEKSFKKICIIEDSGVNYREAPGCTLRKEGVYYINSTTNEREEGNLTIISISNQKLNSEMANK